MQLPSVRSTVMPWLLLAAAWPALADPPAAAAASPPVALAPTATPAAPAVAAPAISAAALEARIAQAKPDLTLLDVRTPEEFAAGHVPGARNIPVAELEERIAELADARDRDLVVYCRTGRRAATAVDTLKAHGFQRLLHLEGDMQGWSAGGHRVERITGAPAAGN